MKKETTTITIRIPNELIAKLDAWIDAQRVQPSRAKVIEAALVEFVDREAEKRRSSEAEDDK